MKFQRRILPPQSPIYLEMEEYTTPSSSRQSISIAGSSSDLSEIESVYSLSAVSRQRSDSLTNLFHLSDDNTSLSNLSIASHSLSQHSCDNASFTTPTSPTVPVVSTTNQSTNNSDFDQISRKQYSSSYKNLTEEVMRSSNGNRRSAGDSGRFLHFSSNNPSTTSSLTNSQKSFPMKTAETVLNTIGLNKSSSNNDLTDKSGLIENDGNDLENTDDDELHYYPHQYHQRVQTYDDVQNYCDNSYVESLDENELDVNSSRNSATRSQPGRALKKTVLNNVDRLLNTGNKQIKL